uniref:GCF C-terminal domain-containing protein n=1 Tax=Kalanchoe fedtschenkoi TaxID=63787 RepID=A0A7N0TSM8_KALFE
MSSSRGRNFRRRADDDEAEPEPEAKPSNNGTTALPSSSKSAAKTASKSTASKPKKPSQQAPNLLSFAEDEDADEDGPFSRPKKTPWSSRPAKQLTATTPASSSGHKITSSKERVRSEPSSFPSNVQPQAGTYTMEALRELQKNTKTLASSRPAVVEKKSESVVVLKGLLKPVTSAEDTLKADDELDDQAKENGDRRERSGVQGRISSLRIGRRTASASDGGDTGIPDKATIEMIRAKREKLRQSRAAAPDYIALDGGSNHGEAEGLSDEEPEFQGRIKMLGEKSDKKGVFEEIEERGISPSIGNDNDRSDDEDNEEKIWEEEQFRKGLGKRMDDGSGRLATSNVPLINNAPQPQLAYPAAAGCSSAANASLASSFRGAVAVSQMKEVQPIALQAESAMKALQDYVGRLNDSFGRTVTSLTKTEENLSASITNVTNLEKSLYAAGEKFIFMQKTRDFVSVICDFLQHKAPFIEELEEEMQKLHKVRASATLERRTADNDDEMLEVEAAVKAATLVFNKSGNSASLVSAATAAAAAAVREQGDLPVKLDEFGRDENLQKRMDSSRRAEARARRKARADSKRMSAMDVDGPDRTVEGESSTDESDSETAAYESNSDQLLQTADQIFSDAAEEYSQLSVVKEKLEKWKKFYSSSYRDAYMALSIPAIFSPYVRLELLKWDPLHKEIDFDNMKWHSLLFDYGLTDKEFSADDADANLVPHLVEKVALPILHHQVANCWDVLSTTETKNAVSAASLIATYDLASSEAFGELLVVVRKRLADAVADLVVPTWNPLLLTAASNASRIAAYRFGVSVRLMRNICMWKDVFSVNALEKLALDELLSGKVLPHLLAIKSNIHDAIIRTERIIASLSGVWAGATAIALHSNKLRPLVDYVLLLGKTLEKRGSGASESEASGLARRVMTMLVELNEYDEARAISRTFQLKGAFVID